MKIGQTGNSSPAAGRADVGRRGCIPESSASRRLSRLRPRRAAGRVHRRPAAGLWPVRGGRLQESRARPANRGARVRGSYNASSMGTKLDRKPAGLTVRRASGKMGIVLFNCKILGQRRPGQHRWLMRDSSREELSAVWLTSPRNGLYMVRRRRHAGRPAQDGWRSAGPGAGRLP